MEFCEYCYTLKAPKMGSFLRFLMLKYVNDGDAATALDIALTKIITRLIV